MPAEPPDDGRAAEALDIEHLASLANLPLDADERSQLEAACREVLEAFGLEAAEGAGEGATPVATFEDIPEPWPEEEVERIREAFPAMDGGWLSP